MLAKYAAKIGMNWDEHLHHLLFAYRTKPHESTGESPFFLLYGHDARIPCESTLSTTCTVYQVDINDYKSELVHGLSEAWKLARSEMQKSQKKQKYQYDRCSKQRNFQAGDRVMVYTCPMNEPAKIESFPDPTLALIKCWRCIKMVSLSDQLTVPMTNQSE